MKQRHPPKPKENADTEEPWDSKDVTGLLLILSPLQLYSHLPHSASLITGKTEIGFPASCPLTHT